MKKKRSFHSNKYASFLGATAVPLLRNIFRKYDLLSEEDYEVKESEKSERERSQKASTLKTLSDYVFSKQTATQNRATV